jgi:dynamin 1-like protein
MEKLIPIASKLQDVLGAVGQSTTIDLPQIAVVGGQSSGKSSVLESLVGRSFLPRGTGIVTRRPLVLQLYNTTAPSIKKGSDGGTDENAAPTSVGDEGDEWGEFMHKRGKKYFDFAQIRQEIVAETDRLTGRNKGVDMEPILLKIYSPRVLSLTLVDLPGIAKVPVGDQPQDIEQQIRKMILHYITNPNAIILAVTPANTDLANSDAIQLAQLVDPSGNRTVGVLTKLDLMDPGTDCADILMNQVIPLRRGYVAVVNRGQKDIESDKSIREGLKKEEQYFKKHPVYARDPALLSKCGTTRLAKSLNGMLMHHIRDCLPDLKGRISHMLGDVQHEVEALGNNAPLTSRSNRGAALLKMLSKFATNFGGLLDGKGCKDLETSKKTFSGSSAIAAELEGGARISYIFTGIFASSLSGVGAFDSLTDEEIRTVIRNANGTRPALFVPEMSFDILVRRQIARLEQPGVQCVDLVYEELQRIALQSQPIELTRYPVLRDRMIEVVSSLLRRCLAPTQMMISNIVKIELAYINTSHPDFIGGSRAVAKLMEKIGKDNDKARQAVVEKTAVVSAVGATPLSSSSLNNYGYEDANENEEPMSPDVLEAQSNANNGIMNYLFRGNNNGEGALGSGNSVNHKTPTKVGKAAGSKSKPPSVVHLPQVPDKMNETDMPPTHRDMVEMEVIKSLVESYFVIIRKNFIDIVPKTIMYMLVNHVRDTMQNELVSELYRDAEMGQLLQEAEDIASRRQTCVEMKDLLTKALDIVNEVRDFNSFN